MDEGIDMGPLAGLVGFAVRSAHAALVNSFVAAMTTVDLRPMQFSILKLIQCNPGVRPSVASNALAIQKANLVPLLNALEKRGLIRREVGASDRRSFALHLTRDGAQLLRRAEQLHLAHEDRIDRRLGAKGRQQLLKLLASLRDVDTPAGGE